MVQRAPKRHVLDFEQPLVELEDKITELKQLAVVQNVPVDDEVTRLTEKADRLRGEIFAKLTAWQQVQLARRRSIRHLPRQRDQIVRRIPHRRNHHDQLVAISSALRDAPRNHLPYPLRGTDRCTPVFLDDKAHLALSRESSGIRISVTACRLSPQLTTDY